MKYLLDNRLGQFTHIVESAVITNAENIEFLLEDGLTKIYNILLNIRDKNRSTYIIGNGGSAAIASHAAIDFMNVARISAHALHDVATLTCMANDYGYENAFSKILNIAIKKGDLLILISSSGQSKNIINALEIGKEIGATVVTLSGFDLKNPLRALGDINIWLNSKDYGMVEVGHQFILHNLSDRFSCKN